MRGPGERLKYSFRRLWECPVCHRRERTGGEVTSKVCQCQSEIPLPEQVVMKLIDDGAPPKRWYEPKSMIPPTTVGGAEAMAEGGGAVIVTEIAPDGPSEGGVDWVDT